MIHLACMCGVHPAWAAGLFLTPRDMARFGLLVLRRGQWGGVRRIVSQEFLRQMLSPSQSLNPSYGLFLGCYIFYHGFYGILLSATI